MGRQRGQDAAQRRLGRPGQRAHRLRQRPPQRVWHHIASPSCCSPRSAARTSRIALCTARCATSIATPAAATTPTATTGRSPALSTTARTASSPSPWPPPPRSPRTARTRSTPAPATSARSRASTPPPSCCTATPAAASARSGAAPRWGCSTTRSQTVPRVHGQPEVALRSVAPLRRLVRHPRRQPATTRSSGASPIRWPTPCRARPCASPARRRRSSPNPTNSPNALGAPRQTTSS